MIFNKLCLILGGFDIYIWPHQVFPQGWDKTFCLHFLDKAFSEIHFFGDKTNLVRSFLSSAPDKNHRKSTGLKSITVLQQSIHLVGHGDIIHWGQVISHKTKSMDWQGGNDYEIFHSEKTIGHTGKHSDLEFIHIINHKLPDAHVWKNLKSLQNNGSINFVGLSCSRRSRRHNHAMHEHFPDHYSCPEGRTKGNLKPSLQRWTYSPTVPLSRWRGEVDGNRLQKARCGWLTARISTSTFKTRFWSRSDITAWELRFLQVPRSKSHNLALTTYQPWATVDSCFAKTYTVL